MAVGKSSASAPTPTRNRAIKGVRLYEEHGHEIEALGGHRYSVPSCTGETKYTVTTDDTGEFVRCDCPDFEHRERVCKHFYALATLKAKARASRPSRFCKGSNTDIADLDKIAAAL